MLSAIRTALQRLPASQVSFRSLASNTAATKVENTQPQSPELEQETDKLYRKLTLEARGHDPAVLKSYRFFVCETAKYLDISLQKVWEPPKVFQRRSVLRSNFGKAKYREAYEARTYFQVMIFEKLTGSTADTFLEYVERNVPEGVAMKVTKEEIQPLPEYLRHRPQE